MVFFWLFQKPLLFLCEIVKVSKKYIEDWLLFWGLAFLRTIKGNRKTGPGATSFSGPALPECRAYTAPLNVPHCHHHHHLHTYSYLPTVPTPYVQWVTMLTTSTTLIIMALRPKPKVERWDYDASIIFNMRSSPVTSRMQKSLITSIASTHSVLQHHHM